MSLHLEDLSRKLLQTSDFGTLVSGKGFIITGHVRWLDDTSVMILLHKQLHCGHILQITIYLLKRCKSG